MCYLGMDFTHLYEGRSSMMNVVLGDYMRSQRLQSKIYACIQDGRCSLLHCRFCVLHKRKNKYIKAAKGERQRINLLRLLRLYVENLTININFQNK